MKLTDEQFLACFFSFSVIFFHSSAEKVIVPKFCCVPFAVSYSGLLSVVTSGILYLQGGGCYVSALYAITKSIL